MQKPVGLDCCFAEYLLNLQDEVIHSFITDHRIKAAGIKTNCNIELTKRILNRKVNGFKWVKYSILRITGPDEASITQCNKLIERVYPPYKYRKEYFRRAPVVLYTGDVMPDNTSLYYSRQRTGRTAPVCGEMRVESPYEIGRPRNPDNVPWKDSKVENAGIYYPTAHGNENLFKFYNLGKISSQPLHYNKEGAFDPPLVSPFEKRGITPSCVRDYQAAGVSKHLKNMAFGKIGQIPPPEIDTPRSESGPQGPSPKTDMDNYMNYGPESPQPHYSDLSRHSNQSASSGEGNDGMKDGSSRQDFQHYSDNKTDIEKEPYTDRGELSGYEKGQGSSGKRSQLSSKPKSNEKSLGSGLINCEYTPRLSDQRSPGKYQSMSRKTSDLPGKGSQACEYSGQAPGIASLKSEKERSRGLMSDKAASIRSEREQSEAASIRSEREQSEAVSIRSERERNGDQFSGKHSSQKSEREKNGDQFSGKHSSQRSEREKNGDQFSGKHSSQRSERERNGDQFSGKLSSQKSERGSDQLNKYTAQSTQERESSAALRQVPSDHVVVSDPILRSEGSGLKSIPLAQETFQSGTGERRTQQDSSQAQSMRSMQKVSDKSRSEFHSGQDAYKIDTDNSRVMTNESISRLTERSGSQPRPVFQGTFQQAPPVQPTFAYNTAPQDNIAYYNQYKGYKGQVPAITVSDYLGDRTGKAVPVHKAIKESDIHEESQKEIIPNSYYGDMIIKDRLPIGHNDPVIIMVDGQDIIMSGNTAMSMTGNEHGKFVMNLGTEDYNISISGDRERLRYMKGGTRNQNQNMKSDFCDVLRSNFQPCLNHVQVIV